jgi:anti-sigma B factor antagonist
VERSSGAAPPLSSRGSGEPGDGQNLSVRIERVGANTSVVVFTGELDLSTIPQVEKQLAAQVSRKRGVIVDLTRVTFIDSSGIALLIRAFRATRETGTLNIVIAAGSQVDRVFHLAGIDRALPLFTERASALEALKETAPD